MDLRRSTRLARSIVGAIAATLVAASCGREASLTAPRASGALMSDHGGGLLGTLLKCTPLPYAVDSEVIGPAGGTLHLGPHTLTIPAGALRSAVMIKGEAPSDSVNSVRFYPHGLEFDRAVSLNMSFRNCGLVTWLLPRVAYTTDGLDFLYYVPSLADLLTQRVTGQIYHFSRYAIAW
jgi:hypothetical protein